MTFKRKLMSDLNPNEKRILLASAFMAAYARYVELLAIQNAVTIIPTTPEDMADFKRLQIWWMNLGDERRGLILQWKDSLWVEVEANTHEYFNSGG